MEREITIDASGRLVIPKKIRESHHLEAGTRLTVLDEEDHIVLVPKEREPRLIEKDGLLVVSGPARASADVFDHRTSREERLDRLGGVE